MLSARAAPIAPMLTDTSEASTRPTAPIRTSTFSDSTTTLVLATDGAGDRVADAALDAVRGALGPAGLALDAAARRALAAVPVGLLAGLVVGLVVGLSAAVPARGWLAAFARFGPSPLPPGSSSAIGPPPPAFPAPRRAQPNAIGERASCGPSCAAGAAAGGAECGTRGRGCRLGLTGRPGSGTAIGRSSRRTPRPRRPRRRSPARGGGGSRRRLPSERRGRG